MKKLLVFGVGLMLVVSITSFSLAHQGEEHEGHMMKGVTEEYKGEVIDLTCYIMHSDKGKGKSHAKCAKACIEKGLPVGILTDHGLDLLVGSDHKPLNKKLAPLAAKTITVHGKMYHQDGMMLISVSHIGEKEGSTTKPTKE